METYFHFFFYSLITFPELSLTRFFISSSDIIAPFCLVNFSSSFLKSCASISSFFFGYKFGILVTLVACLTANPAL